ncbi:hypothetical protein RYZ26_15595 [Terasakiella sp. A23]|uniref:MMPL family transporter n=1 Tax=Terasakiella sp. FCG-A23 TaxID=3080561 RepID=UPI002953DFA8|nr:hypothetical protein [Terasakiella sp. A23]MDV7341030.1 hypothetical protein [Terasakiella sp. A23]
MRRIGTIVWSLVLVLSLIIISVRFADEIPVETDFLSLLPDEEQSPWVREANQRMKDQVTQRVIVLIKADDFKKAASFADEMVTALMPFATLSQSEKMIENLGETLFQHRSGLLSDQDRIWLQQGDADKVVKRAWAQIMSAFGFSDAKMIRQDPYLLFPAYLAGQKQPSNKIKMVDGWQVIDGHILLSFTLKGEAFDQTFQAEFVRTFESLTPPERSDVIKTGAVFYAERGVEQAQSEATFIGALSLAGIILLNIIFLRSLRPILLALLAISSGVIGGLGVCLLIFGKLHLMAFVFGAGLIGIAVDYTFHYCCDAVGDDASSGLLRTKNIAKPLTLGVISSSLGFLILATAPFPGLQQIAVFATVGLVMAYVCVMCIYPFVDRSAGAMHFKRTFGFDHNWCFIIGGVSVLLAMAGAWTIHVDDDVRRLQSLPVDLKVEEEMIRNITGLDNATRLLLVKGADEEAILQKEEQILIKLENLRESGALVAYQSMAQVVPSLKRQNENRQLIEDNLLGGKLDQHLELIGMKPGAGSYDDVSFLKPDGLLPDFRLSPELHLVRLSGVTDLDALSALAEGDAAVRLVDQAKDISETLGKYRERALILIGIACCVIWGFLTKAYGVKRASLILSVPVSAVVMTPFIAAVFGESFTFFNAMALLLVLAIGLDYALFNFEADSNKQSAVMLANSLSAASTIMAFGLLALSDMYAIHAFGVTILIGISIAYMLAPLVQNKKQESLKL